VKTGTPDPAKVGGNITYTVTVTNVSNLAAENATVTDQMPAGVTVISATPSQGTCQGTTCNLGTINPGAAATIEYVVKVNDGAPALLTNVACVATSTPESNMSNNCDDEDTHVPTPTPLPASATPTPKVLPVTGGLPGNGGNNGLTVLEIGLVLLLAGGFVAALSRRRAANID
jgi:uncharacterized repeat protein (TIGR01451 family)